MRFEFEWDPRKTRQNAEKHGVTFDRAAGVFRDPRALSVYDMRDEYDFSKGERGKFYQQDAVFNLPVYLDEDNRAFVEQVAHRENLDVSTVVNSLIRADRETPGAVE